MRHTQIKNIRLAPTLLGLLVLLVSMLISSGLRQQDFDRTVGPQNLEATYHVLLTVTALNENPVRDHWYLPTVSLSRELDKKIPWGATVASNTGDYFYTSFYSPGFLAPYIGFKALRLAPSIENLSRFNTILGFLSAFIIFLLMINLLQINGYSRWQSVAGGLVGSTIAIFSSEALLSHGVLYWSQSFYQPILACSLYLLFKYLSSTEQRSHLYAALLLAATFVGPLVEWTGFVFNAGLVVLFWLNRKRFAGSISLATIIIGLTGMAGAFIVVHYALVVGFEPALRAFLERFLVRSTSHGNVWDLLGGYVTSYGLFFLAALLFLRVYRLFGDSQAVSAASKKSATSGQITRFVFFAASVPLLENLIMLQHATQFSFDRLKFIFPASLALAFLFLRLDHRWRRWLLLLILLATLQGYLSYKARLDEHATWASVEAENRELLNRISAKVDLDCAVLYSNIGIRGYANLLFHRGIYEYRSLHEGLDLMREREACASVYLEAHWEYADLQKFTLALVTYPDGSTSAISHKRVFVPEPGEIFDSFYQTDNKRWSQGVSRKWAGFYVPKSKKFLETYTPGKRVKFANGEIRTILLANTRGSFLEIKVDGELLDPASVGAPNSYHVIDDEGM